MRPYCLSARFFCLQAITCWLALVYTQSSGMAQEYSRNEFTVGANLQSFGQFYVTPAEQPARSRYLDIGGPSLTYTHNLSPSLAIEGTFVPTGTFRKMAESDAGRETLALGGVKTGWRGRRWGFYGKVQAGVANFSCGDWIYGPQFQFYTKCTRLTDFAIEYGGVAEYRLSSRYAIRVDAGHLMLAEFDHELEGGGPVAPYREGAIRHHLDAQIGVTRRFGGQESVRPEGTPDRSNWDAGVLFALQPRTQINFAYLDPYPEWGLWASWNFSKYVSWDTSVLRSPRNQDRIETIDYQAGGRAIEALTGAKVGIRRDHMGYFAKIRPGTITFSKTQRQLDIATTPATFDNGMFTDFVLDTGGVLEVYPSRHSILRFEAGDAQIFYRAKDVYENGAKFPIAGKTQPSLFAGFGAGFRF